MSLVSLLLRNSLLYGGAQLSRGSFFLLVAVWFGFSREADKFFLAYGIATFLAVALSSTFSRVLVSKLTQVSWSDVLFWPALLGLVFWGASTLAELELLAKFTLYVTFSLAAGILAGRLANEGKFYDSPAAMLFGGLVFLFAALSAGRRPDEADFVVSAMAMGEFARLSVLASLCFRRSVVSAGRLSFSLFGSAPLLVLATAALGSTQLIARSYSWFLAEGAVATFSYAYGLVSVFVTIITGGLMVTRGFEWKEKISLTFEKPLLFRSLALSGFLVLVSVSLGSVVSFKFAASLSVLAFLLPLTVLASVFTVALVASGRYLYLLQSALAYVATLVILLFLFSTGESVVGVAWAVLIAHALLVVVLSLGVRSLVDASISSRTR